MAASAQVVSVPQDKLWDVVYFVHTLGQRERKK